MKVAIICDVLGKPNNGTTIAAYNLIRYLREQGHDVRVLCCDQDKNGTPGFTVVPVCNLGKFLNGILERNGVSIAKREVSVIDDFIEGADVVHLLIPLSLAMAAAKAAVKKGIPISASFHCQAENVTAHLGVMNCHFINHIVYKFFWRHLYRYCTVVHYPTQFIRDLFEKECGHKTNGYVISNGVNQEFFDSIGRETEKRNDKFTIVCSGRYSKEKAQHVLIEAVANSKYKDKIRLILAGSGPKEKKLKKLAARKKVDTVFRFFDRKELIDTLYRADLYVHTAKAEIEAISCTEAIVCGLVPVICNSKMSATKAFALDGNNLFEEGNRKDLTNKIEFWYEHPDLKTVYKEKYFAFGQTFNQRECMRRMEDMLYDAAGHRRT